MGRHGGRPSRAKIRYTISCVFSAELLQSVGMIQNAILTKWKFLVEFEDNETREISGTIGEAETHEECGGSIEDQMQYHRSRGRTVINAEAWEVCAQCEGAGLIPSGNDGRVICEVCGGHLGSISPVIPLKIAWPCRGPASYKAPKAVFGAASLRRSGLATAV